MNAIKCVGPVSGRTSSSEVRSDTLKAVRKLSIEQIERLASIVEQGGARHQAYHGVYSEESLAVQAESVRRSLK